MYVTLFLYEIIQKFHFGNFLPLKPRFLLLLLPPPSPEKKKIPSYKSKIKDQNVRKKHPSVAALQEERKQTLSKASNIEAFPFSFPPVKTVDYRLSTCLFTRPSECRFSDDSSEINFSKSKRKDSRTGEYDWKGRNTGKEGVSCNSSVFSSAKPNKLTSWHWSSPNSCIQV